MIFEIFGWFGFIASVAATVVIFIAYLRARTLSNRLLAVASNQFFEATDSLLKSAEEIPMSVLEVVETMNDSATKRKAHWTLLKAVKLKNSYRAESKDEKESFAADVQNMRPELRDKFEESVIAWLNYLTHQNIYTMARIGFTVMKHRSTGLDHSRAEAKTGFDFLSKLRTHPC
jgi:ABC-type protease/lipase transport system fused ATPase/permease subunit